MPTLSEPSASPPPQGRQWTSAISRTGQGGRLRGAGTAAGGPLSLGLEGQGSPHHSWAPRQGSPSARRRESWPWWRVAGQGTVTQTQTEARTHGGAGPAWQGGRWTGRKSRRGRAQRARPRAIGVHCPAQVPRPRPPHSGEDSHSPVSRQGPDAALAEAGVRPLLPASPSPHKQSGRTHRPSRSFLFGSQSCEMQQ